jgi:hypothetical protein
MDEDYDAATQPSGKTRSYGMQRLGIGDETRFAEDGGDSKNLISGLAPEDRLEMSIVIDHPGMNGRFQRAY